MKKGTKLGIGLAALLLGGVVLTGCTNSFCSSVDRAHILYAIDYGVCRYFDTQEAAEIAKGEDETGKVGQLEGSNVYYYGSLENAPGLKKIHNNARDNQYLIVPSINYYIELDNVVLKHAIEAEKADIATVTAAQIGDIRDHESILCKQGYLKYYGPDELDGKELKESKKLWVNWNSYVNEVRLSDNVPIDECPTADYISFYQTQMKNNINAFRSCLATKGGYYGHYGQYYNYDTNKLEGTEVQIQEKSWAYAWQKVGFLSGLLVYPIGWLIDTFSGGLKSNGLAQGWASLLAILFVTIIVRSLMLAATFKQTTASSKMQELQPELAKIQAKYPNSNTNQYEKQRLAQETQALYKKHKINPFSSLLVMIVQFPVFICVWGAMQGSAQLSSGAVLGLNLSQSISSVLTTWSNWKDPTSGVWTALVLFLLMSGAQTVAMLLPQWIAKAKKKKIAKLGRNPAQKESDNKMKWFTYIMLAMIIFMGFSLVSALGVYWLVGALFSIAQTLITHAITERKNHKKK